MPEPGYFGTPPWEQDPRDWIVDEPDEDDDVELPDLDEDEKFDEDE